MHLWPLTRAICSELMIERITETPGLISADEFHFFRIFPAHLLQIFQYKPVVGGYRLPVFDLIPVKTVAAKCVVFFMDIHSYIKYTVHRGLPLYAVIPVTLPSIVSIQVNPRPYNGEVTSSLKSYSLAETPRKIPLHITTDSLLGFVRDRYDKSQRYYFGVGSVGEIQTTDGENYYAKLLD